MMPDSQRIVFQPTKRTPNVSWLLVDLILNALLVTSYCSLDNKHNIGIKNSSLSEKYGEYNPVSTSFVIV